MRRAAQLAEVEEPDRIEGQSHPRETYDLLGQDEALARAARAIRTARTPQGWLLAGEPGIGKATLAYRIARYLLRYGTTADGPADLFVAPEDMVSRQIEAQAHPGLLVLKRPWDEERKRLKTVITVREIRRLGEFFGLKSTSGGWRIALIDAVDEMNPEAANALLKNLEEPPARSLLILISHAPGRLLPTIRSRVQRLDLKPLNDDVMHQLLETHAPDLDAGARKVLARLSDGSIGLALRLSGDDAAGLAQEAEELIAMDHGPDWRAILKFAERVGRRSGDLQVFGDFLNRAVSRRVRALAEERLGGERSVELAGQLKALFARAAEVNLEPRQTVLMAANLIASAKQHRAF